jgi:hypothetical protein
MQRFRGSVYLDDGAILPEELTVDGRHWLEVDDVSWHVLILNASGSVSGCLRVLDETSATGFDDLWVGNCGMARSARWRRPLREAVESEMHTAQREGLSFGEVGGWAIAPERRCTMDALRIILATYGLLQLLGGFKGVATATCRHCSSTVLRRIGLSSLLVSGTELPSYFDPQYRCEMEVLRFDSRRPNPRYLSWVLELTSHLARVPVLCSKARQSETAANRFERPFFHPAVVGNARQLRLA